jgi:hypothetical protein
MTPEKADCAAAQADEAKASAEAAKVKAIKDECEADLAEALPALNAAIKVRGATWVKGRHRSLGLAVVHGV